MEKEKKKDDNEIQGEIAWIYEEGKKTKKAQEERLFEFKFLFLYMFKRIEND